MPDAERLPEARVRGDLRVHREDAAGELIDVPGQRGAETVLEASLPGIVELRLELEEREAPPQGEVDECERPVRGVHRADDVEIVRQVEALFVLVGVGQLEGLTHGALRVLEKGQHLAEGLRWIAAVELLERLLNLLGSHLPLETRCCPTAATISRSSSQAWRSGCSGYRSRRNGRTSALASTSSLFATAFGSHVVMEQTLAGG